MIVVHQESNPRNGRSPGTPLRSVHPATEVTGGPERCDSKSLRQTGMLCVFNGPLGLMDKASDF